MLKSALRCVSVLPLLAAFLPAYSADRYPTRPVRLLVGFPPGGPTDLSARLVGQYLAEPLGQQFVIDNRPGAGGTLAAQLLIKSAPDGHTLFLGANGEIAIAPHLNPRLPYDPARDLAPVSRIGSSQLALMVHPSVPAQSTKDLIAVARAKPGTINFASSGQGSTAHLSAELFKALAGVDIVHVPYKGAGPAMTDLMGGQVQMMITGFSAAVPHMKSGKLRGLAVTGTKRIAAMPELPTIAETVPGYQVNSWYGLFAPSATPQAIIKRLHSEIATMVQRPEVTERLVALGIDPEGNSPQAFAAQIRDETARWGKVVKAAGVKGEF